MKRWTITPNRDDMRLLQVAMYPQRHRDLNRRRSTIWKRLWMRMTGAGR